LSKILWDDINDIKRSSPQKECLGKDENDDLLKGSIPPIDCPDETELDGLLKGFGLQSDWPDDRTKQSGPPSCDGPDTEPYHWLIAPSQAKLDSPSEASSHVKDVAQMGDSTDSTLEFVWPEVSLIVMFIEDFYLSLCLHVPPTTPDQTQLVMMGYVGEGHVTDQINRFKNMNTLLLGHSSFQPQRVNW